MPIEGYFPPIGFGEQSTRDDFDRWMKFRSFQQQAVVYVAANNTPDNLKYMAKYKCDGTGDEVEIQQAFDELPTVGLTVNVGEVVLLPGTYNLDNPIIMRNQQTLRGSGYSTSLNATSSFPTGRGMIESRGYNEAASTNLTQIRDMQLTAASTDCRGVAVKSHAALLISGLYADKSLTGIRAAIDLESVNTAVIENCTLVGFQNTIALDSCSKIWIRNCDIEGGSADGIDIDLDCSRIWVTDNEIRQGGSHCIDVNGADCLIRGNWIGTNSINGIDVDGDGNVIAGNIITIDTSGTATNGIELTGDENLVTGNRIDGASGITNGIQVSADALRNRIGVNTIVGVTNPIVDSGDGTRYPPGYQLDYAEITADHALTGSEADITGLETATFNATASAPRHVRVRAHFSSANDTAGGRNKFNLKTTGGTYLDEQTIYHNVANDLYRCTMEWQGTITADTAWEVRGFEVSGQGRVDAATTWPAFIEVLDLGVIS